MFKRLKFFIRQHIAKIKTLIVWMYLMEHPRIYAKRYVPSYWLIRNEFACCPLCSLFMPRTYHSIGHCSGCPLGNCTVDAPFGRWVSAPIRDTDTRLKAAREIVDSVKAWRIKL